MGAAGLLSHAGNIEARKRPEAQKYPRKEYGK
mgnify:CR=1 FL=1